MESVELMTSVQVAKTLEVSRREVTRMVMRGQLKPMSKLPGQTGAYVFHRNDVMDYVTANREKASK